MKLIRQISIAVGVIAMLLIAGSASASAAPLTASTRVASEVGPKDAKLNGSLKNAEGGALYGFEYGTTAAYGSETDFGILKPGTYGTVFFSSPIKGLTPETTYHYRAAAIDSEGKIVYGGDQTFTTTAQPRFQADSYPATLSGEQSSSSKLVLTVEGGTISCNKVTVAGELAAASGFLSLTPAYSECSGLTFLSASMKMNGCTYMFSGPENFAGTGPMSVVCPEGSSIEITAADCKLSIPAQAGLNSVTASTDTAAEPDRVALGLGISNLKYTKTKDGLGCPFKGTGTKEDGGLSGSLSVGATNEAKAPIGLRVE